MPKPPQEGATDDGLHGGSRSRPVTYGELVALADEIQAAEGLSGSAARLEAWRRLGGIYVRSESEMKSE